MKPTQQFVVLLAHGSSDPQWLEPFIDLERRIQSAQGAVRLAFMELADPSLEQVIEEAHQSGYTSFTVLPLFFAAGRHLRQDVPRQLSNIAQRLNVETHLLSPVGDHPLLADALLQIVRESVRAAHHD